MHEHLTDCPVLSAEIYAEAKELGITQGTLKGAKKTLGIISRKLTSSENEKTPFVCEIKTQA